MKKNLENLSILFWIQSQNQLVKKNIFRTNILFDLMIIVLAIDIKCILVVTNYFHKIKILLIL